MLHMAYVKETSLTDISRRSKDGEEGVEEGSVIEILTHLKIFEILKKYLF